MAGSRGKTLGVVLLVVVLGAGALVGYRLMTKEPNESILPRILGGAGPPVCPLTGEETEKQGISNRRVLAVKIENTAQARPQAGLDAADIVYEQEAEGGITRFIAMFHCRDSQRLGPIRSARPVDPLVIRQYGEVLFVHSGSVPAVVNAITRAGITDINCNFEEDVCPRDPARVAPHDVFTSTRTLLREGGRNGGVPEPVFPRDEDVPTAGSRRGQELHLNFSPFSDVMWRYDRQSDRYFRYDGGSSHTLEDGSHISTPNVIVQVVDRETTQLVDSAGNPVPTYDVVGRGPAYVFRNGRVIIGRWQRGGQDERTVFVTRAGDEIPLAPGSAWIELFPSDASGEVEFS